MAYARHGLGILILAAAAAGALDAQLIPVRVVPIAQADQFDIFPSANFGMANVSIALPDSLLNPYHNPALGSRIRRGLYFGSPTFFSVTNDAGSGQTYPLGGFARLGRSFVGGTLALQEINPARSRASPLPLPVDVLASPLAPVTFNAEPNQTQANRHAHGTVGHTFPGQITLAASASWADLRAMEGMELLFTGSHNVRQRGDRSEVRLGLLREWGSRSLEVVALASRLDMSYVAGYAQLYWDPGTRQQRVQTRDVRSATDTRTTGLHLKYELPAWDSTWRAGAIVTGNQIRDAGAPFYEFMGVPLDASQTRAFNFGAGLSRRRGATTFAVDAILEPVWRRASGIADTNSLALFAPGTNVEESYFKFRNVVLRGGVARDIEVPGGDNRLRLQFGAQMRNVNYTLEQHDLLRSVFRERKHSWREWTHAWGTNLVFPRFEFGYQLRLLSGMGRLGVPPADDQIALDRGLFPVPGPQSITLYPVRIASHQMFFTVPLR